MLFLILLEFINQLFPTERTSPNNIYEAKKYMKGLGLRYEKIWACCNECMLFWKDNKKLERCAVYKKSK